MNTAAGHRRFSMVLFFVPAGALLLGLMVYPFVNGLYLSFTDASPGSRVWSLIGLENYTYVLTDPTFWETFNNSVFIVATSVALAGAIGFALALLLNENLKGTRLFRTIIFQGWIVPWITVAVLWGWLFNFDYGIINFLLIRIGVIDAPLNWLANGALAQTLIISGFVWRIIPFMMVMSLAALQGVPVELLEAARIDGANYRTRLFLVVLPLIRNTLLVAALLQSVRLFQEITLPLVATQGGPINATTTLSLYTYKLAFQQWDFGLAATVGALWSVIIIAFSSVFVWLASDPRRRG